MGSFLWTQPESVTVVYIYQPALLSLGGLPRLASHPRFSLSSLPSHYYIPPTACCLMHAGADLPMAVMLSTAGAWVIRASLVAGSGQRYLLGSFDQMGRDACHVAISWACINATKLRKWFGGGMVPSRSAGQLQFFTKQHDLSITTPAGDSLRRGPSLGTAAALSLVSCLLGTQGGDKRRRFCVGSVGITGAMDLRGRVLPVSCVKEKCWYAMEGGAEMVIWPRGNVEMLEWDDFQELVSDEHPGLREYVREKAKGASDMLDVVRRAFEGKVDRGVLSCCCVWWRWRRGPMHL